MADRSHLSIGEVLSLLRDEFPDVTISKIRFLESQGLVDPERTPSGYRKFYEHDVERLRWILRQQRENFLPLKVIKGRLTDQDDDDSGGLEAAELELNGSGSSPDAVPVGTSGRAPAVGAEGQTDPSGGTAIGDAEGASGSGAGGFSGHADSGPGPSERVGGGPGRRPSGPIGRSGPGGPSARPAMAGPAGADDLITSDPSERPRPPAPGSAVPGSAASGSVAAGSAASGSAASGSAASGSAASGSAVPGSAVPGSAAAGSAGGPRPASPAGDEDDSFTLDELMSRSGLDKAQIDELTRFGLISPVSSSGGDRYYDADAVAIATASAGFARHGVEARHLRAWRTSAEREVSLFEQVVVPLLRQRNPQARNQAAVTLDELAALGASLRDILIRRALREVH